MKATGIVRRVDSLGRIVVPKEIRRTLRLRDGDPMEIFTASDGAVVFKKYSPLHEAERYAAPIAAALSAAAHAGVLICDRETVLAASADRKKAEGAALGEELPAVIEARRPFSGSCALLAGGEREDCLVCPVISDSDAVCAVVLLSQREEDAPLVRLCARLLAALTE